MSRVSSEQAARNRHAVLAAASTLIRRKGLDGVGVRELMASVGLTQGAFAKQFQSKELLAAEAYTLAFQGAERALGVATRGQASELVEYYLSPKAPEEDCPMATLAMDAARSPEDSAFRQAYTDGLGRLADLIAGKPASQARLTLLAAMVGAAVLQRAMKDCTLAEEINIAVIEFGRTMDQTDQR
jgi:TetR/AcrR family transcriptional regulator, transcriptional repressor for nem operon